MFKNRLITMAAILCLLVPVAAMADDTEIYGVSGVTLEPNVMIIMDNSGSMKTKDVPSTPYDPTVNYSDYVKAGYYIFPKDYVYYYSSYYRQWRTLTTDKANITCPQILSDLETYGYAKYSDGKGIDSTSNLSCGTYKPDMRLGNFRNYERSTLVTMDYRYEVAKASIAKLLDNTTGKRFGLMHFYTNDGGYVKFPCDSGDLHRETISTHVKGMVYDNFNTNTPLAETLSEAGRYFAGKSSWFTDNKTHTSPVDHSCQKNYIILVTDGEPTQDTSTLLYKTIYMNNKVIGDYYRGPLGEDKDFNDSGSLVGSLLNDVASFLYSEDILHPMGDGTSFVKQNVITHTIGFTTNDTANDLLALTATCGGGDFYSAGSSSGLDAALEAINSKINETNSIFLAPAVPVNRTTRTSQSDWLYLAYFRPQNTGEWVGNIKKFAIGHDGHIYGSDGEGNVNYTKPVVDEMGMIDENACSFWTEICNDGNQVTKGGVGSLLAGMDAAARKIYYYTGTTITNLTNSINAFTTDNAALSVPDDVILNVRKFVDTEALKWKLGAIIHSEPAIVHYSNTQSVIYVGANDGMFHCFDDTNGQELWAFIPPGQKTKIETVFTDAGNDYYVDGSPAIVYGDLMAGTQHFQPKYMIFGERRGGSNYYVLDITDYNLPIWKYQISPNILSDEALGGKALAEALGQSWSKARICTLATATETVAGKLMPQASTLQNVFMLSGGYDTNQDLDAPAATDSVGKAIVSVQIENGTLGKFRAYDTADGVGPYMKNCILDINTTSTYRMPDGTEITTRVYAGDMGGKVFTFADDREVVDGEVKARVPDGAFPLRNLLFNAPGKKIFYAPATSKFQNSYTEWVVFGTGDRENPLDTSVVNHIYAVKNTWLKSGLTKDNLVDLTQNLIIEGTDEEKDTVKNGIKDADGWSITFYDPGEKMISSPIVSQGFIFFTTYVPASGVAVNEDPCKSVGANGASYLWAIELDTGAPAYDLDGDGKKKKHERRIQVAAMAQPKMIGDLISTPKTIRIPTRINFDYFFWRQR